jgi:tRNA(Ser,Leu) C12 N-acetylase TAN1
MQIREWNVLATSLEGRREALIVALRKLGPFWRAGYRNVLVGQVNDQRKFLQTVRERLPTDMQLAASLTKIVPVEQVVTFEPSRLAETLVELLTPCANRIAGKSFHVRVERRGLKGVVHTPTVERTVGEALLTAAGACGAAPTVSFRNPDVVVAVETTGETAGVGFLTRELRGEFPFVKVP